MKKNRLDSFLTRELLPLFIDRPLDSTGMNTELDVEVSQRPLAQARSVDRSRHFTMPEFAAAAAEFGENRYGYVVSLGLRDLTGHYQHGSLRRFFSQASFVLTRDRLTATLLSLLEGIRVPDCKRSDLQSLLLTEIAHEADRIVIVGESRGHVTNLIVRHDLTDVCHQPKAGLAPFDQEILVRYLEYIEQMSPFRFCLLCLGSPYDELIAYCLQARDKAKGLAICLGAE